jgi:E3 ubiquitin-protein ligase CHFR
MFEESAILINTDQTQTSSPFQRSASPPTLKRPASPSFEGIEANTSRKRKKMDSEIDISTDPIAQAETPSPVLDLETELAQELECPCCSALVYRPVVVSPCQHFFCGSCCSLWIQNGGTTCPACRGVSTVVQPSRPLQVIIDAYLRACPSRARSERERNQADEIYRGSTMRFPSPRESSPPPDINLSREYMRPCPHCSPGNPYGWSCPHPIPDPSLDLDNAWHIEDGIPPGHVRCGHCESLMAIGSPVATRCDFCLVSFCGIVSQARCSALPISAQEPHSLTDLGDFVQSTEIYECFEGNSHEVEILLDYLASQGISPRHILNEIVNHYRNSPNGFRLLFENGVFADMWTVDPCVDPDPSAPRRNSCRMCAAELLLSGLRDWWIRERQKGLVKEEVLARKDCPDGFACHRQSELAHAKEFNHILMTVHDSPARSASVSTPSRETGNINIDTSALTQASSVEVHGSITEAGGNGGGPHLLVDGTHPDRLEISEGSRLTALPTAPTHSPQPASGEEASLALDRPRDTSSIESDADVEIAPTSSDADPIRVDHLVRFQAPLLVQSGTH